MATGRPGRRVVVTRTVLNALLAERSLEQVFQMFYATAPLYYGSLSATRDEKWLYVGILADNDQSASSPNERWTYSGTTGEIVRTTV